MANAPSICTYAKKAPLIDRCPSDVQLLESYAARRDDTSFAMLVRRHAGTVWKVCRGALHQEQDAEDAFQETFILLFRKAAAIHKPEAVGSWLYGVAYRVAMKVRRSTARRQVREQKAVSPTRDQPPWSEAACRELQRILDEEVQRLGEKYRVPFVLCCLEGLTKVEAAQELGWKKRTVSGRAALARQLLQKRLARRGITLSAVLTAVTLAQSSASAAPPSVMLHATDGGLTGNTSVGLYPKVIAVADALVRTMAAAKRKALVALVLALTTLVAGVGTAAQIPSAPIALEEPEIFVPPPVPLLKPIDEQVLAVAFSPDGKRLVTAGARHVLPGQLMIWNLATGKEPVRIRVMRGIRTAVFSPDGQVLACGHFGGDITLRDPHTGQERRVLKGHTVGVNGLAFSANSKLLLSAGLDRVVKLWDVDGLKELKAYRGTTDRVFTDMVFSVAFFHHKQSFVTCGQDGTAGIWDLKSDQVKFLLKGHTGAVEMVAVSPDDTLVATASWDKTVKLWDANTGKETAVLEGHKASVFAVAFSPDGTLLASAAEDGSIHLWDVKTGKLSTSMVGSRGLHPPAIWSLAFSRDGKLLASGSSDRTAKLWILPTLNEAATLRTSELESVRALAYAPDGKSVAIAMADKAVQLRDANTGDLLLRLNGHDGPVNCLGFSPDGQTLASGSADKTVKLWDLASGKEKRTLKGHLGEVYALAFSPDGKHLASSGDKSIKMWDPVSGEQLAALQGHEAPVRALAFALNGFTLASGGADKIIRIWPLDDGTEPRPAPKTLQGHVKTVRALAFSGDMLASASDDGTVKVWRAAGGKFWMPAEGREPLTMKGHAGAVISLAFLRGGRTLVSGGDDGNILVLDALSGQMRGVLQEHREPVTALAIHPQGRDLLSASHDARVVRWQRARGNQVPAYANPSNLPSLKLNEGEQVKPGKQLSKIEDIPPPPPKESYAREFYHSFKDNPEDNKDFELMGPDADEAVKFEAAGLKIVLPAARPGPRLSTGISSRFAIKGDFEITLRYEILKEAQGSGLFLGVDLNTMSYNRASLTRGLRDRRHFFSWFQQTLDGSDKPYRDQLRVFPSAGMAASLRMVRTGSDLASYVSEGTGDQFTLLWHHPFGTEDVKTVRLGGQTSGPLDARLIDLRVRADSLPDMPDVPLAAQEAGSKTWLLLSTLISFSALVCLAVWLYARHRGALPAPVPAVEHGGRADGVPPVFTFACSSCGKKLRARQALAGKKLKCPHCGLVVRLSSTVANSRPVDHP